MRRDFQYIIDIHHFYFYPLFSFLESYFLIFEFQNKIKLFYA